MDHRSFNSIQEKNLNNFYRVEICTCVLTSKAGWTRFTNKNTILLIVQCKKKSQTLIFFQVCHIVAKVHLSYFREIGQGKMTILVFRQL